MSTPPIRPLRLVPLLMLCAGLCTAHAVAAGEGPAPRIAAGPLDQVLARYSLASGVLLGADGALTRGLASPGLGAGALAFEPGRDLEEILAGSGLRAERQPGGEYVLRAAAAAAGQASAPAVSPAIAQRMPEVALDGSDGAPAAASRFINPAGTPLALLPQAVSIVDARRIDEQGLASMDDVLQYVAGVQAGQGEGNRDSAVLRGYNSSADFFLDGMRDNMQYFRDFYNIDSVEVLKGPEGLAAGRGGFGGVINRVVKQPLWRDAGEASLTLGAWQERRARIDINRVLTPALALRVNAVSEDAGSFRDGVRLARHGINPALAWRDGDTLASVNIEHFRDSRSTDRGVPSLYGRPVAADLSTFFGDVTQSPNWIVIDRVGADWERSAPSGLVLSNQFQYAHFDKLYQNIFSGGVDPASLTDRMLGYNSATRRNNLFDQGKASYTARAGAWTHVLSGGFELGRERVSTRRSTAYFDTLGTDVRFVDVPLAVASIHLPASFRPSATDADNASRATTSALYLQDQLRFAPGWQLLAGVRYEMFKVDFSDLRKRQELHSLDRFWSPRLGLLYEATPTLALYLNQSIAHAPRAGEQLASLTGDNLALAPEQVRSLELGAKWQITPALQASAALYRLRRSNVVVADAVDAGASVLVDGQRGHGLELEMDGQLAPDWRLAATYARQQSTLTATQTASARVGASMPAVPRDALSLWSRYQATPALGLGLGLVSRSGMYASTSNLVTLPGFARLDGAATYRLRPGLLLQLNLDNLLDRRYYRSAVSDNNISPGAPRALRVTLDARL